MDTLDTQIVSYIYLLQDGKDKGTNIYKIGRTSQQGGDSRILNRMRSYSNGTIVHNIFHVHHTIVNEIERIIKDNFSKKYCLARGSEWFAGDVSCMKKDIDYIIDKNEMHIVNTIRDTKYEKMIIKSFGNENIDHLSMDFATECLYLGEEGVKKMIKTIYFNDDLPENYNIRFYAQNQKLVEVFTDRWEICERKYVFDTMMRNAILQIMLKKNHEKTYQNDGIYKICSMNRSMKKRIFEMIEENLFLAHSKIRR